MTVRPLRPILNETIVDLQRWYPEKRPEENFPADTFEIALVLAGGSRPAAISPG
jgi:hypothetical protein